MTAVFGPDGLEYGYAKDIADQLTQAGIGNAYSLIRHWHWRGILAEAGHVGVRPYFRVADVMAVERDTRDSRYLTKASVNGQTLPQVNLAQNPANPPGSVMFEASRQ